MTSSTGACINAAIRRALRIGPLEIDDTSPCFVIAEIGHNHQGSVETCKKMFDVAARCGADGVKLQKRDNRTLFTRRMYDKPYENENSYGRTYGEHRDFLEFGRAEYLALKEHATHLGLIFFSTAFDVSSVDFLEEIDLPAYKVASADVTNLPLLRRLGQTGRPVIFSTGGAQIEDVRRAHDILAATTGDIAVLQCTAGYPAAWEELDLRVIDTYRRMFPTPSPASPATTTASPWPSPPTRSARASSKSTSRWTARCAAPITSSRWSRRG